MKRNFKFWLVVLVLCIGASMVMSASAARLNSTVSVTAENTWTDNMRPMGQGGGVGYLNISVSGSTWSATVSLQRSFDDGVTWHTVTTYTENAQQSLIDKEASAIYRLGVATGDFTSGTVICRLSR